MLNMFIFSKVFCFGIYQGVKKVFLRSLKEWLVSRKCQIKEEEGGSRKGGVEFIFLRETLNAMQLIDN